jgi:O-antigen ligase
VVDTLRTARAIRAAKWLSLVVLGLALPVTAVMRHQWESAGVVGLAAMLSAASILTVLHAVTSGTLPRHSVAILVAALPVLTTYVLSAALVPTAAAIDHAAQLALVIGFTVGMSVIRWPRQALAILGFVSALTVVVFAAWWVLAGFPMLFSGPLRHPNALGLLILLLSFFVVQLLLQSTRMSAARWMAASALAVALPLLYATQSRAAWLALLVAGSTWIVWRLASKSHGAFHMLFVTNITVAVAITYGYLIAPSQSWGWRLQALSVQLTGQNLFSGRQLFWDDLWSAILERPWLGHGAGATAEAITGLAWSAHNWYIQTALQVGFVGLALLLLFLWAVWSRLRSGRDDVATRLAAAYFAGLLIHQVFETSLTQANLATGFILWLIVAIGLSRAAKPTP